MIERFNYCCVGVSKMVLNFSVLNTCRLNDVRTIFSKTNSSYMYKSLKTNFNVLAGCELSQQRTIAHSTLPRTNNDIAADLIPILKLEDVGIVRKDALDICEEDVSDHVPVLQPSFNFAAYVNDSPTLQEFVKLGVHLYKFEKDTNLCNYILSLDYKRDMEHHLRFLCNVGVPEDNFGHFLTKNPLIFKEDLENLHIRINYLESKNFKPHMISHIITANPVWLSHATQDIDSRLGFLQQSFDLIGNEVREITVKKPKLITSPTERITKAAFVFKEEMGFSDEELKTLVVSCPTLFMMSPWKSKSSFEVLHQTMNIPHEVILRHPQVLTCRAKRIQPRHSYLKFLKRDQYDPKKANYVSLLALVVGSDIEFCQNIAKTSIESYNTFLKSL